MPQYTITREELYERVWKTPILKLATEYNVSDVAIAKTCKRLNVPRPPRGYWAKLAAGKQVPRPKLPAVASDAPQSARLGFEDAQEEPTDEAQQVFVSKKDIEIPDNLRGCHPLVSATRQGLEAAKPNERKLCYAGAGQLDVVVCRGSIPRALRLLEALVRACEGEGWKVETEEKQRGTRIVVRDDPVSLLLIEKPLRIEIEAPEEEKKNWWWRPRYRYEPTGCLMLQITDYLFDGSRRSWSDGKRQRLETMLGEVVTAIDSASNSLRKRRLEHEKWTRNWHEQQRLQEEQAAMKKVERERRAELERQAANLQKARNIRALVAELMRRQEKGATSAPQDVARWSAWAEALARRFDPFENGYFARAFAYSRLEPDLNCEEPAQNSW